MTEHAQPQRPASRHLAWTVALVATFVAGFAIASAVAGASVASAGEAHRRQPAADDLATTDSVHSTLVSPTAVETTTSSLPGVEPLHVVVFVIAAALCGWLVLRSATRLTDRPDERRPAPAAPSR